MIHAKDLRKSFGSLTAVDGVCLDIPRGEAFGLLGPNGAGKTTTIHMLVGVLTPDSGTIEIDGHADPTKPATRRRLGIAPQKIALYEPLSARQNLSHFGKLYALRGKALRQRVDWALELAGLTQRADDAVQTYSGGMQRRLNLACALVHEPACVLCDEPTVGIDPQSRNHIFDTIERLKAEGLTVIYTTHYMEEAQRLCDRVAIMDQGRVLALGTPDELIRDHAGDSLLTAEFRTPPDHPETLPGTVDGTKLRLECADPVREATKLVDLDIASLTIDRPDLESVFLKLTGRRLRDD